MLHYHVWFNLRPEISEADGLEAVSHFLNDLLATRQAESVQLLANCGKPPRSRLPRYHALVEFLDGEHLSGAMRRQADTGIHIGLHGAVTRVITDMHVEIFETKTAVHEPLGSGACDV